MMNFFRRLFRKRPKPDGVCQCGHEKCYHWFGASACTQIDASRASANGIIYACHCMTFVQRERASDVLELERLVRL